jgi:hypothetical protein
MGSVGTFQVFTEVVESGALFPFRLVLVSVYDFLCSEPHHVD